jgi:hypothetical protein
MKTLVRFFVLLASISSCYAQAVVPPNIRATNTLDNLSDMTRLGNGDLIYGIPIDEGKVVGDTYLNTHWQYGNILLYEKEQLIEGFPVRYDIRLDELEVKARNGVKVLMGNKVRSFVWADSVTKVQSYYVNAGDFKDDDNVAYTGFFQVLSDGALPLFKKTVIDIKKADYNVQLNVGSHDDKILKKSDYYTMKDKQVVELPSGKKKLVAMFPDKSEEVEKFIRDSDLAVNREDHLRLIFEYYNSLVNN